MCTVQKGASSIKPFLFLPNVQSKGVHQGAIFCQKWVYQRGNFFQKMGASQVIIHCQNSRRSSVKGSLSCFCGKEPKEFFLFLGLLGKKSVVAGRCKLQSSLGLHGGNRQDARSAKFALTTGLCISRLGCPNFVYSCVAPKKNLLVNGQ